VHHIAVDLLASGLRYGVLSIARENESRHQEGIAVPEMTPVETTPVAAPVAASHESVPALAERTVEVVETMLTIHELCIERSSIVTYLATISPEKQTIALVHALEVGVTEMIARRERFRH
jgi:hypothetical protein